MLRYIYASFKAVLTVAPRSRSRATSSASSAHVSEAEESLCNSIRNPTKHDKSITPSIQSYDMCIDSTSDVANGNPGAVKLAELSARIDSLEHDLEQEQQSRVKAESEVQQLSHKLKTVQNKWKRTASELDRVLSQAQVFNPVTDEELISMARQLQYNIRGFSIQYFSEPLLRSRFGLKPNYAEYLPEHYDAYLRYPENFLLVVQSFVWHVLASEVFDRFVWAGGASEGFDNLWDHIAHARIRESQKICMTTRKLHAWRATTTGLVLDHLNESDVSINQKSKAAIMHEIQMVLNKLSKQDYKSELDSILDEAINLDKVISSQAAKISWRFLEPQDGKYARKKLLSTNEGRVVVCPAMVKRGKSNGEDFDGESVLLPRVEEFCNMTGK
ncbi:hypothetical protein F4776DRAFT_674232 [Hypoxylon sp. NC0597]|nr:hypothetical protein F4776DRAFT_674232 [Hypoxylon sp. NC0597]